jgi:BirA family biotin operon repressor/biotin-[acetyl-CoA-carboxylase] ligase
MQLDAAQVRSKFKAMAGGNARDLKIHTLAVVTSTNTVLWELVNQGTGAGTVVLAEEQRSGKGQRDRQWQSPPGGLYLSVVLTPHQPATSAAQLTICSAWGIAMSLRQQGIPVQIKWLNDLVIDGYKLGGILTETRLRGGMVTHAVIGCGLNWRNPVPPTGINLVMLPLMAEQVESLEQLGAMALHGIFQGYDRWQREGIAAILADYNQLLYHRNQTIELNGLVYDVLGITETGSLRLKARGEQQREMYLPPGSMSLGYARRSPS